MWSGHWSWAIFRTSVERREDFDRGTVHRFKESFRPMSHRYALAVGIKIRMMIVWVVRCDRLQIFRHNEVPHPDKHIFVSRHQS